MNEVADVEVTEEAPRLLAHLDAGRYVDPSQFDAELDRVFGRSWLLAARVDDLPETGAVERVVGRRPIALTREDCAINALHNVCSHRGNALVESCIASNTLRCPFHGWTYGLDGRVVAIPGARRFAGLDPETCGLRQVACRTWGGWVWVSFADQPPDFEEWLGAWAGELARYLPQDQRLIAAREDPIPVNWKAAVDAFNETYHVSFIHGRTVGRLVHGRASRFRFSGEHSRMVVPIRGRDDARPIPGKDLLPEQLRHHVDYTLFPNTILNMLASWGIALVFEPVAVDRTLLRTTMIADPGVDEEMLADQWRQFGAVLDEDLETLARTAAGMSSPAFSGVRLGGEEQRLVHFHEAVDAALTGDIGAVN